MIAGAKHCIAFTGAGISTGCGVPDFRSGTNTKLPTGPGVWQLSQEDRQKAGILDRAMAAKPGSTHNGLSRLWRCGLLKQIVSQNVDGLHRKSGVAPGALCELHGNLYVEVCPRCGAEYERDHCVITAARETGRVCEWAGCGSVLRDSGVRFGDPLPEKCWNRAWQNAEKADLCLCLGSSLTVTPASEIPAWVARRHKLVIVNLQATPLDGVASLLVHGMVDEVMERVLHVLDQKGLLNR